MKIRDRIKSLRRVKASELLPNPRNWRRHPQAQQDAMRALLAEIGFAGAALARETSEGLQLIDGHLRAELAPDAKIPVLVLDVTEAEAAKLLATFDPVGKMAEAVPAG
jgi:ParB-like chromosome segregation protein Spo0J